MHFSQPINAWIVTRYRDVQHVLSHPEIWANDLLRKAGFSMFQHAEARTILESNGWQRDTRLQSDPPIHRDYRNLVATAFTAGRVRALAPFVASLASELSDEMAKTPECDFMTRFAAWLPIRVITRLLGLPVEDAPRIKSWSDAWVEPLSGVIPLAREIEVAKLGVELQEYLADWMAKKRSDPSEDVLSTLANARFADGSPLPIAEKIGLAEHLIVGGHETVTSALGSGLWLLIEHPEVERALRADRALMRNFVEEVLRLESPSQGFFRYAERAGEVASVTIPRGAMVHVRFAAANRDPEQFPDPDMLDLRRKNAGSHMAFSQGEHHCVGAPLARLELAIAFDVLLDRFERFELVSGTQLRHLPGIALRTLAALPIRPSRRRTEP